MGITLETLSKSGWTPDESERLKILVNVSDISFLSKCRMCVGMPLGPEDFEALSDEMMVITSFSSQSPNMKFWVIRFARKSLNVLLPSYLRFSRILSAIEEK